MSARVILLHGPAAAGKFTIAKELSDITGFALFHNHLVVDMLLSVFNFGSPGFVHHRERIWLEVIGDAVAAGTSLIFTFNPERTVSPEFPQNLADRVGAANGTVASVEIRCSEEEIERRIASKSRQESRKLNSLAAYRQLREEGAFAYPPIPTDFSLDTSNVPPEDAARQIADALAIPVIGFT